MQKAKRKVDVEMLMDQFAIELCPLEMREGLLLLTDRRTNAQYCECHIKGDVLARLATTDSPLDPEEQPEYRANRDVRVNHPAFVRMTEDAQRGRSFSNIVAEYHRDYDSDHPLKIVGGQHRFQAIQRALQFDVNEYHGIKVYFGLDKGQRMDVQLISNTNIAVSSALFDRMDETAKGPNLRDWCQSVGLLGPSQDFSDQHSRGAISVRLVRSFITNYLKGRAVNTPFEKTETTPVLCPSGDRDPTWDKLVEDNPDIWEDQGLFLAGKEFALLVASQRAAFRGKKGVRPDHPDKALNIAVASSWAFVAGLLSKNEVRLRRHYSLRQSKGNGDPLNAESLAKGRFKTDATNYRGLGNRTDAKERGRLVELFHRQAEKGTGVTFQMVQNAINQFEMKALALEIDAQSD
jgi:hypothetical protein